MAESWILPSSTVLPSQLLAIETARFALILREFVAMKPDVERLEYVWYWLRAAIHQSAGHRS
jgi:hypothetical protein